MAQTGRSNEEARQPRPPRGGGGTEYEVIAASMAGRLVSHNRVHIFHPPHSSLSGGPRRTLSFRLHKTIVT